MKFFQQAAKNAVYYFSAQIFLHTANKNSLRKNGLLVFKTVLLKTTLNILHSTVTIHDSHTAQLQPALYLRMERV